MNMQGVCDAQCRFLAVTCKHVGSTNDAVAYVQGSLKELCESQQFPYHWNGDDAYTLSESMMIPFTGTNLSVSHPCKEMVQFLTQSSAHNYRAHIWNFCPTLGNILATLKI